jgi:DNA adenine methylase
MLRYNKYGGFNIPFGRYKTFNVEEVKNTDYENVLQHARIMNNDFEDVFNNCNSSNNFCFIDQPYDSVFTDYGYCKFDKKDQERLCKCFKATTMKCLMIVGETDYIRELYDGYIVDSYPKKYRFKLHSKRVGDDINNNHLIIKNY